MNIFLIIVGGVIIAGAFMGLRNNNRKTEEFYSRLSSLYVLALAVGLITAMVGVS